MPSYWHSIFILDRQIVFLIEKINNMAFRLPDLEYDFDALEPFIDARTMEIHYSYHHASYLKKFNEAIKDTELEDKTPKDIFSEISKLPPEVRNNGGGFFNHTMFFRILSKDSNEDMDVDLADIISKYFGTIEMFKKEFSDIAANQFGSGWAWLLQKDDGQLIITSTPNQDNPLMDINPVQGKPLLCLDLWEHAYYLKYQNRKSEYIDAFWNIINWDQVAEYYKTS